MNTRELTYRQALDALKNLSTESPQGFVEDAIQLALRIEELTGWTSFSERMPTREDAIDGYLVEVWSVSDVSQTLTVPLELLDAATIAQYQLTHWRRVQKPEACYCERILKTTKGGACLKGCYYNIVDRPEAKP